MVIKTIQNPNGVAEARSIPAPAAIAALISKDGRKWLKMARVTITIGHVLPENCSQGKAMVWNRPKAKKVVRVIRRDMVGGECEWWVVKYYPITTHYSRLTNKDEFQFANIPKEVDGGGLKDLIGLIVNLADFADDNSSRIEATVGAGFDGITFY